jgi:hypothetical protein
MKQLLLLGSLASLLSIPGSSSAGEPDAIRTVGPGGLRIEGEIKPGDLSVFFKLSHEGKPLERDMVCKQYQVELTTGKRYTVAMDAARQGLDPYLVVKDEHGNVLAFDDDSGGNLNALLSFDPPRKGVYKIYAAALNGAGRYVLRITEGEVQKKAVNIVRQGFPAAKAVPHDLTKSDTAWEIEWTITSPDNGKSKSASPSSVLAIRSARFMFKDNNDNVRWFTVLKNLEVGEILVPYDRFEPVFLDVSEHSFHLIPAKKEYLGPSCVLPGEILDSADPRMKNKVLKEVHDDGLRWLNGGNLGRRGEKLTLWSIFDGGNYRYLIEYNFKDDGSISCRLGATAHNFFNRQSDQRDVHLHVACWRWDPELAETGEHSVGGAARNRALLVRRLPRTQSPSGRFKVELSPFNANELGQASEGFADWKADEFTILRVESLVRKNAAKEPHFTAYDLVPVRLGTVRNYPWKYDFANHDFWITRRQLGNSKFRDVPLYATYGRSVEKTPMTIWHNSPTLHVPRSEDYGLDGQSRSGAAMTTWAEFILRPVNLFDSTPLYLAKPRRPKSAPVQEKGAQ